MRHFIPLFLGTLTISTLTSCSAPPAPKATATAPQSAAAPATAPVFDAKTIAGIEKKDKTAALSALTALNATLAASAKL